MGHDGFTRLPHLGHWQKPITCWIAIAQGQEDDRTQAAFFQTQYLVHGGWIKSLHRSAVDSLLSGSDQANAQRDICLAGCVCIIDLSIARHIVGFEIAIIIVNQRDFTTRFDIEVGNLVDPFL